MMAKVSEFAMRKNYAHGTLKDPARRKGFDMLLIRNELVIVIGPLAAIAAAASSAGEPAGAASNSSGQLPDAVLQPTKPIFDGKTLDGWIQIPANSWEVKDGAMASRGVGRGVI